MAEAVTVSVCPACGDPLRTDGSKMNVRVSACPRSHGLLVNPASLAHLIDASTSERLRHALGGGLPGDKACPSCDEPLRGFRLGVVDAHGCNACGALWFDNDVLRSHVLEVRRRAFGASSLATRADVHDGGTSFLPADIVAGILTDYALGDESPNVA